MKDRIKQIMEIEGLSPSKFAESIGIQRSAMSHYMTGRNDPSVDVLRKIHERYPDVSLNWLLAGNGDIMEEKESKDTKGIKRPEQLDIFSAPQPPAEKPTPPIKPVAQSKPAQTPEYPPESTVQSPRNVYKASVQENITMKKNDTKNVTKIMLFYSDDTFETFIPEKTKKDR